MTQLSALKKKAWKAMSEYVRLSAADENGFASCVTCQKSKHWKEMQAGHFVPQAQGNAARFDPRNVHVQCYRCNMNLGGNGPEYAAFMLDKFGAEEVEEIRQLAGQTRKITRGEYLEMIEEYESKILELLEASGD